MGTLCFSSKKYSLATIHFSSPYTMRKTILLSLALLLAACSNQQATVPPDATDGEIRMAEMMGITVEELRNQTPEEHMKAMQELKNK